MFWHRNSWQKIHFQFIFALPLVVIMLCGMSVVMLSGTLYADTGTWVDGSLPSLQVLEQSTVAPVISSSCYPTTFTYFTYGTNPNSTGHNVDFTACATQNQLGMFGTAAQSYTGDNYDFIKPHTSIAFRVLRPGGRPTGITPVPNQGSFFWKDASDYWGNPVAPHFYTNFAQSGDFGKYSYGSNIVPWDLAYELNTTGTVLTDSAGTKIYMKAYAFSQNGQWMVMEAYGLGLLRVNMQTLEMQLFSQDKFAYNLGFAPGVTLAISDDGNSAIKSGFNAGDTKVYDLSGCQSGVFTFNIDNSAAMTGCRNRSVQQSLQAQLSNYQFLQRMHFNADGKSISAVAISTGLNGIRLYNTVQYSVAGYQQPQTNYIALGDSFSSGEGAYDYVPGTNETENKCHLSFLSYPYMTAYTIGISDFHSVACSGATTLEYGKKQNNMFRTQSPLGFWVPGYQGQKEYLNAAGKTSIVTITMIGNDIGFGDKLATCLVLADDCYHFREDREMIANEIYGKFDDLVNLYRDIKQQANNPNVKIYVMGYPQIMGSYDCQTNVSFSFEERQMAQGLTSYLDAVIKAATLKAGVQYIDIEHAFDGHRLCDSGSAAKAVNGLTYGSDRWPVSNGSFHPNALGHYLMSQALLSQSDDLTRSMPIADDLVNAPYTGSDVYNNFIANAPSANFQGVVSYTSRTTTVVRTSMTYLEYVVRNGLLTLKENGLPLMTNAPFIVMFHSDPIVLGTLTSDAQGNLDGDVIIPPDAPPGYHTLHIIGKDIGGQDIDAYQVIYVAASADDFNGDGIPNSEDKCVIVPASGVDQDKDGIDDACDAEITEPPADTTPPHVTGAADRSPDYNGWYNHDVTITWSSTDPDPSSGAPGQPTAISATIEGDHAYVSDQSCDPAGNCATGTIALKLDKTAPDIGFTINPAPNALGWNNGAVTVTFTCSDTTSGIESCTQPVTVTSDGGGYIVTGTAVDNAGNSQSINAVVMIDSTAPQIAATVEPEPNIDGWNNTDTTLTPACSDDLSGIAQCDSPTTVTSESLNQSIISHVQDNAGNTASITTKVNIDKTAPTIQTIEWSANPKATTGSATLTVDAADNLSGIKAAEYFLGDTDPGEGHGAVMQVDNGMITASFGTNYPTGVYKVTVRVEDYAGNWSQTTSDYLVVYNPFSIRMTGKKFLAPSLSNGDNLPGLISTDQTNLVKFGFNIGYDATGSLLKNNDFQFSYTTGTNCDKPALAQNCHTFTLNAISMNWLTMYGSNNCFGAFKGTAIITVDGIQQPVVFLVTGLDGERLDTTSSDHLDLQIFAPDANVSTAAPMYQVNDDVIRGSIHIKL